MSIRYNSVYRGGANHKDDEVREGCDRDGKASMLHGPGNPVPDTALVILQVVQALD